VLPTRRRAEKRREANAHSVVNSTLDGDEDVDEGGASGEHDGQLTRKIVDEKDEKEEMEMERVGKDEMRLDIVIA